MVKFYKPFIILYDIQKKTGVTRIIPLPQINGKLPLPWWKQGNYLVISICVLQVPATFIGNKNPKIISKVGTMGQIVVGFLVFTYKN